MKMLWLFFKLLNKFWNCRNENGVCYELRTELISEMSSKSQAKENSTLEKKG
jgi:hypothetical protein